MFDNIKQVFRTAYFEPNHNTGEAQFPVASFRPIREYAPDGIAYRERRVAVYDFTVNGGAVSTITLAAPVYNNETIVDGLLVTDVAAAGATATIAVGTSAGSSTTSLLAATAVASFGANVTLPLVPVGHGTGEVKLTADGFVSVTIAVAALTAGKFYVFYDVVFTGA